MYFWNDKKLANDLNKKRVSEKEQAVYLLLLLLPYLMLTSIFLDLNISEGVSVSIYDHIICDTGLLAFIITLYASFKINKSNDNTDFVARYVCISFPIGIKTLLLTIILFIPALILDIFYYAWDEITIFISKMQNMSQAEIDTSLKDIFDKSDQSGPYSAFISILVYLYIFSRFTKSFKIASGQMEYNK